MKHGWLFWNKVTSSPKIKKWICPNITVGLLAPYSSLLKLVHIIDLTQNVCLSSEDVRRINMCWHAYLWQCKSIALNPIRAGPIMNQQIILGFFLIDPFHAESACAAHIPHPVGSIEASGVCPESSMMGDAWRQSILYEFKTNVDLYPPWIIMFYVTYWLLNSGPRTQNKSFNKDIFWKITENMFKKILH